MHPDYKVVVTEVTDVNADELNKAWDEYAQEIDQRTKETAESLGVSEPTASAIEYLRGRSRWTQEKEQELIDRDKAGDPIPIGSVLSGEF